MSFLSIDAALCVVLEFMSLSDFAKWTNTSKENSAHPRNEWWLRTRVRPCTSNVDHLMRHTDLEGLWRLNQDLSKWLRANDVQTSILFPESSFDRAAVIRARGLQTNLAFERFLTAGFAEMRDRLAGNDPRRAGYNRSIVSVMKRSAAVKAELS